MLVKSAALGLVLIGLFSDTAGAQRNPPLFLDARNGDDPAVIDVTEITGQYSKAAVEEYQKGIAEGRKGNRAAARIIWKLRSESSRISSMRTTVWRFSSIARISTRTPNESIAKPPG